MDIVTVKSGDRDVRYIESCCSEPREHGRYLWPEPKMSAMSTCRSSEHGISP